MMTLPSQDMLATLQWYQDHGVDEAIGETPVDRLAIMAASVTVSAPSVIPDIAVIPPEPKIMASPPAAPLPLLGRSDARQQAVQLAASAKTLEDLALAIQEFEGVTLKKTATRMVFSDGNPDARVMLVGEAPGADEDRMGKPFVGVSGQLLDRILKTIDLDRAQDDADHALYISNILNWRPPGNRTPSPAEIDISLPFIECHIQLVKPRLLLFCGAVAAKALLGSADSVSKLRKKWHDYVPQTSELVQETTAIPALVIYHPAYLLRTPSQKKAIWADMISIKNKIKHLKSL